MFNDVDITQASVYYIPDYVKNEKYKMAPAIQYLFNKYKYHLIVIKYFKPITFIDFDLNFVFHIYPHFFLQFII